MLSPRSEFVCSVLSNELNEQLIGTASHERVWFLLQYDGPWGAKAFEQSDLPEIVKEHVTASLQRVAGARLLLIKSREDAFNPDKSLFVVNAAESHPAMRGFQLETYEDLLSLDLVAAAESNANGLGSPINKPLFVVCTNGRRDPCCARYGPGFYQAMLDIEDVSVWQSTHVGGHRFAANSISFPHGIYYGRMAPQDALPYVRAVRSGQIYLDHLRGRAVYPEIAQAAEYYLRRETGRLGVEDFHLEDVVEDAPQLWLVRFLDMQAGNQYRLSIHEEVSPPIYRQSCISEKVSSIVNYTLEGIDIANS